MRQQKRANVVCVQAKKAGAAGLFITAHIHHLVTHLSPQCNLVKSLSYLHTLGETPHINRGQKLIRCTDGQPWDFKYEHCLKPHDPEHIKQS